MNRHPIPRRTVLLAGAAVTAAIALPPGSAAAAAADTTLQPYASYWFPDSLPSGAPQPGVVWRSLKEWDPRSDPDLPFNTASVPLARRFAPPPPNTTAHTGQARVSALAAFDHTSGNPSQGSPTADYYALTQWAYLDELVFWGGSSGEGLVLAPNAPVIDAAHRHGVPVLGTVFLPPVAYGGDLRWTRDLVQRDAAGGFPVADKMALVCSTYGFDGWFINAETDGGDSVLASDMRDFVAYLRARGLRVTWYDAMTDTGAVNWQNQLDAGNQEFFSAADAIYLNFDWDRSGLASSAQLAQRLGRSRYAVQAGVDVESNGWDTQVDWEAVVPAATSAVLSYGFYRPEWTWTSLPQDQRTPAAFHDRDDRFWTGRRLDPTAPGGTSGWRAPASAVGDRSMVTALPFATSFNTGHGLGWYEQGVRLADTPWNHLGLQDRLPARRWVVRTTAARPAVGFDFADAWHGGSSLLVNGALGAATTVELYSVRLAVSEETVVDLVHRSDSPSGGVSVELAVALAEPPTAGKPYPFRYLPVGTLSPGGQGWTTATLRLGRAVGAGHTVHALGVRLTAQGGGSVRWRLGSLAVHNAGSGTPAQPGALRVTAAQRSADGTAALRLAWGRSAGPGRAPAGHPRQPRGGERLIRPPSHHAQVRNAQ
ncbi:endo-beta-N-acetylglucosaminidase, partial [Streptomyces sp. NPDC054933]